MNFIRCMKANLILMSLLLLIHQALLCQVKGLTGLMSVDGFLVNNGDTLFGSILWKQKYIENNPYAIRFTDGNGESRIYDAGMISGLGTYSIPVINEFDEIVSYEPENYECRPSFKKNQPVFLNRLMDGRIKVFLNRSSMSITTSAIKEKSKMDGINFSFSPGEGLTIGPTYKTSYRIIESRTRYASYFVEKNGGTLLKISRDNYDEFFRELFDDCPAIQTELEKNPVLKLFKNFMLLTEIYNQLCK